MSGSAPRRMNVAHKENDPKYLLNLSVHLCVSSVQLCVTSNPKLVLDNLSGIGYAVVSE